MTMRKKLVIVLAMAVLCIAAVGSTLSYFTDAYVDVNVMTVGKVEIAQHEQYRLLVEGGETTSVVLADWHETDEYGEAVQSFGLYPYTGLCDEDGQPVAYDVLTVSDVEYGVLLAEMNAVDKIVTVENTGTEAAYIRTVFAFEMKKVVEKDEAEQETVSWVSPFDSVGYILAEPVVVEGEEEPAATYVLGGCFVGEDPVVIYKHMTETGVEFNDVAEDAVAAYVIATFTYLDALAAPVTELVTEVGQEMGEEEIMEVVQQSISAPSLLQVYLYSHVGNEFYVAVGGEYEVLVLSQGVQTQGFAESEEGVGDVAEVALDTAFGVVSVGNEAVVADWFNETSDEVVEDTVVNG